MIREVAHKTSLFHCLSFSSYHYFFKIKLHISKSPQIVTPIVNLELQLRSYIEEYEEFKAKVEKEGSSPVTVIKRLIKDYLTEQ